MRYRRSQPAWRVFGKVQRVIRARLRLRPRSALAPTFQEFCAFITSRRLSPNPATFNSHWRPIYLNCAPCQHR